VRATRCGGALGVAAVVAADGEGAARATVEEILAGIAATHGTSLVVVVCEIGYLPEAAIYVMGRCGV
jgi:hypothetical protein